MCLHMRPYVCIYNQASNFREATKAMASVAPGLGLGAPLKDSHRLCDFLMEVPFTDMKVPFAKDKWPCPFKNEILRPGGYLYVLMAVKVSLWPYKIHCVWCQGCFVHVA